MQRGARRLFNFFQVFLPSWRFFDRVGSQFTLQYRWLVEVSAPNDESSAVWRPLFSPLNLKWYGLFLNAEVNAQLALDSLVERVVMEISTLNETETAQFMNSVSYEQLVRMVRQKLKNITGERFQFRLLDETGDAVLVSLEHSRL